MTATSMTDTDRIALADKIAAALNGKTYAPMTDGTANTVRVYLDCNGIKQGHIVIGRDGRADIEGVKRAAFEQTKRTITDMGIIAYRGAGR